MTSSAPPPDAVPPDHEGAPAPPEPSLAGASASSVAPPGGARRGGGRSGRRAAHPAVPRWPRAWFVLGPLSVVFLLGVVASAFVRVPYVTFSPGGAYPVEPAINLPKGQGYGEEGGNVLFLTVTTARDVPVARAAYDWIKGDSDVFPVSLFFGDRSPKEDQRVNEQAMDDSKSLARLVAFRKLGYDVRVRGTGVVVGDVDPSLPAASALHAGDVITAIDGKPVATTDDLTSITRTHQAGDTITLSVERQGQPPAVDVPVVLSRNEDSGQPIIGISGVATRDLSFDFPFPVNIDSGTVSGPSAGLGFTLALIDRLTPGSLTGGKKVAVTGAIRSTGEVRPIGGVQQKVLAAENAGADLMIVPTDDYAEAKARAGDDLDVYKVDSLDDALAVLQSVGGDVKPVEGLAAPGP